ncbi:MAG: outer membrane protein [Gammaproteobacteria bacterium]
MKLWQQISILSLGCVFTASGFAGVVVDRAESGSVKVLVDGNETNTVQSDKASKLSLSSTRSKIDSSEKIEVEVDGVKNTSASGTRTKKDRVSLNAIGNSPVQIEVGSSDTATTETSTVDVNAHGGAKVDVALDSNTTPTSQVNYVEVNAVGYGEENTSVEVESYRSEDDDDDSFFDLDGIVPVIAARVGIDDAQIGHDQDIAIQYPEDRFEYTDNNDTQFVWGLFAGVEIPLSENGRCRWQTGAAYYRPTEFEVNGIDYRLGLPDIADRSFKYSVQNQRLMWENKFLLGLNRYFSAYALGAIGWSQNKASDYDSDNNDGVVAPGPSFGSHTSNSFSYSFGLGLEVSLAEQLRLGLGYQFTDLGQVKLAADDEYPMADSDDTLERSSTPTNEVILGLTYLFN